MGSVSEDFPFVSEGPPAKAAIRLPSGKIIVAVGINGERVDELKSALRLVAKEWKT